MRTDDGEEMDAGMISTDTECAAGGHALTTPGWCSRCEMLVTVNVHCCRWYADDARAFELVYTKHFVNVDNLVLSIERVINIYHGQFPGHIM